MERKLSKMERLKEYVEWFRKDYLRNKDEHVVFLNDFLEGLGETVNATVVSMGGAGAVNSTWIDRLCYKEKPEIIKKSDGYIIASFSTLEDVYLDYTGTLIILLERMHDFEVPDNRDFYIKNRGNNNE